MRARTVHTLIKKGNKKIKKLRNKIPVKTKTKYIELGAKN